MPRKQLNRFRDLVRRGVIDFRSLPHPLNRRQREEADRLTAETLERIKNDRSSDDIPF